MGMHGARPTGHQGVRLPSSAVEKQVDKKKKIEVELFRFSAPLTTLTLSELLDEIKRNVGSISHNDITVDVVKDSYTYLDDPGSIVLIHHRLETDDELFARLRIEEKNAASTLKYKLEQFERLKKELGK
jgi:hypothetical protein